MGIGKLLSEISVDMPLVGPKQVAVQQPSQDDNDLDEVASHPSQFRHTAAFHNHSTIYGTDAMFGMRNEVRRPMKELSPTKATSNNGKGGGNDPAPLQNLGKESGMYHITFQEAQLMSNSSLSGEFSESNGKASGGSGSTNATKMVKVVRRNAIMTPRKANRKGMPGKLMTGNSHNPGKTTKSILRTWLRNNMLGIGQNAKATPRAKGKSIKKDLPGLLVIDPTEPTIDSDNSGSTDDLSSKVNCLSANSSIGKSAVVPNPDQSGAISNNEMTTDADTGSAQPGETQQIDFRSLLDLYKVHSSTYKRYFPGIAKKKRMSREPSFALLSFSVAPSNSHSDESSFAGSYSDDDDDSADETLFEYLWNELRGSVMGEEETGDPLPTIKEVIIPSSVAPKIPVVAQKPAVLSPRPSTQENTTKVKLEAKKFQLSTTTTHENQPKKSRPQAKKVHSSKVRQQSPLSQFERFFNADENQVTGRPTCGDALQVVPTFSL